MMKALGRRNQSSSGSPPENSCSTHFTAKITSPMYVGLMLTHPRPHILTFLVALLCLPGTTLGQQVLKDISQGNLGPEVREVASTGDQVFISGADGSLWVTDATGSAMRRIQKVTEGANQGLETHNGLFSWRDRVLMRVQTQFDIGAVNFWISDGTESGTVPLTTGTGYMGSYYNDPVPIGQKIYFRGSSEDGPYQLWQSDGTQAGTMGILGLSSGTRDSPMIALGGRLLFNHQDPLTFKRSLSAFDVNSREQVDLVPEFNGYADILGSNGDILLFLYGDESTGPEPWVSDGTPEGTHLLAELTPGPEGMTAWHVGTVGNTILFERRSSEERGIWSTAGTPETTHLLLDQVFVSEFDIHYPSGTEAGGRFVFGGSANEELGVWETDGTPDGTRLLMSYPRLDNRVTNPGPFTTFGQDAYFAFRESGSGTELWSVDGSTRDVRRVTDIEGGLRDIHEALLTSTDAGIVFTRWPSGHQPAVWFNGGSDQGTRPVPFLFGDAPAPGSDPGPFLNWNDQIFFTASSPEYGRQLWTTNASPSGTRLSGIRTDMPDYNNVSIVGRLDDQFLVMTESGLVLFQPSTERWSPISDLADGPSIVYDALADGDAALMVARAPDAFPEVWLSDGTSEGTMPVTQFDSWRMTRQIGLIARLGDRFLFSANVDLSRETDLYAVDIQTGETTILMHNIGPRGNRTAAIHASADHVVISTENGLVQTDGTPQDTRLWDIFAGERLFDHVQLDELTYFRGPGNNHSGQLWVTDGTEAGTTVVKDLCKVNGCPDLSDFMAIDNRILFISDDTEFWVSDGLEPGTRAISSQPHGTKYVMAKDAERLVFRQLIRGENEEPLWEYWTMDLESYRFRRLFGPRESLPGMEDFEPGVIINNRVVFSAYQPDVGKELFFIDLDNPLSVQSAAFEELPEVLRMSPAFPNPFRHSTWIPIDLPHSGHVRADVVDLLGRRVALIQNGFMPAGSHQLTVDLVDQAAGMYLVRVSSAVGSSTRQVVKIE